MQSGYLSDRSASEERVGHTTQAKAAKELRMRSRLAATVLLSMGVFIVVTLLVSVGVLWWTGDATRGVRMGVICGGVAVFTVGAVSWAGRSGERSGNEHERSRGGGDR